LELFLARDHATPVKPLKSAKSLVQPKKRNLIHDPIWPEMKENFGLSALPHNQCSVLASRTVGKQDGCGAAWQAQNAIS